VALYPDSLLSQIFMASTYPLEVVEAERWVNQNSGLQGDELAAALESQNWDPSVKSLVNFPDVLIMMSEKLDWTQKLGDAFLAQQADVLNTVQELRRRAQEQGNLKTTEQQVVAVEQQDIVIEPVNPQVIYVPVYDPTIIYGAWPYPAYPPYYWYPHRYSHPTPYFFGPGFAVGAAWGYAWGRCNWHGGDVEININQNANFNRHINRDHYVRNYQRVDHFDEHGVGKWHHSPVDRKGVPYRDPRVARTYNRTSPTAAIQSREAYRGRADQGRQDIGRNVVTQPENHPENHQNIAQRPAASSGNVVNQSGVSTRPVPNQKPAISRNSSGGNVSNQPVNRQSVAPQPATNQKPVVSRDLSSGYVSNRGEAFQGVDTGSAARNVSARGQTSRQATPASSSTTRSSSVQTGSAPSSNTRSSVPTSGTPSGSPRNPGGAGGAGNAGGRR
jgi:hypothetical protein